MIWICKMNWVIMLTMYLFVVWWTAPVGGVTLVVFQHIRTKLQSNWNHDVFLSKSNKSLEKWIFCLWMRNLFTLLLGNKKHFQIFLIDSVHQYIPNMSYCNCKNDLLFDCTNYNLKWLIAQFKVICQVSSCIDRQ